MNLNEKKQDNKEKISIIIVIILLIIIIALGIYLTVKNNNTEKNTAKLEIKELGTMPVCFDSANEQNILCKFITLNDKPAYSIDYACEKKSSSNIMTWKSYLSDQGMAIMINGYPNKTPEEMGCLNADEAYMATQMAFWEIMNRTGEANKSELLFRVDNVTPISGQEESCDRITKAAKKLVKSAEENPYNEVPTMVIDNEKTEMKDFDEKNEIVGPYNVKISGERSVSEINYIKAFLSEKSGNAKIVDENGNDKTIISNGDNVYIKFEKNSGKNNIKIKFESSLNRKVGYIYEDKNKESQDYVQLNTEINETERELAVEVDFTTTLGKIIVKCINEEGNPVSGSTLELLSSDEEKSYGQIEAGDSGIVTFYKIPEGKYKIKQVIQNSAYELKDEDIQNITVNGGETSEVTLKIH